MQRPHKPKFSIAPVMDFRSKINEIIARTVCLRHSAQEGDPCWLMVNDSKYWRAAICGTRINQVYNGRISQESTRRNGSLSNKNRNASRYPKKEHS